VSKLTTKNYKTVKNYIAKHGVKEASTKYGFGTSTIYLIKRFNDYDGYKQYVYSNSRQARERKEFIAGYDNSDIIDLNDLVQTPFTDDQKDYVLVLLIILIAVMGLACVLVSIIL